MQVSQVVRDETAVSPVIGTILLVAITVILATIIGVFAVGLGEQAQTDVPNVDFDYDYDDSAPPDVTITHERGQEIDAGQLEVQGASPTGGWGASEVESGVSWTGEVDTGAEEVRVVWRDDDGRTSHTIARSEVPS